MSQKYFEYFKYKIHIAITNHISKMINNTGQFKHAGICNLSLFYSRQWSTTATKSEHCLGENNRKNMESEKRYYSSAIPVERAKENPTENSFVNRKGTETLSSLNQKETTTDYYYCLQNSVKQ